LSWRFILFHTCICLKRLGKITYNSQVRLSSLKLNALRKKSRALPLHSPARCSDILRPDVGNMTVVISATEAELMCLSRGLLKQHNRLTNNNSVPNSQRSNPLNAELNPICHLLALLGAHHIFHVSGLRIKPLESSEKGTKFITLLRLSVDLRGCVQSSRCTAARKLETRVRVLPEK